MSFRDNPKVSVLIPAYNVAEWIEESLLSILGQSYENIEVIVVDDCSTDGTYEIIRRVAENEPRMKVLRNERNMKIVDTLNYGLTHCTGDFVLRHDGDDVSEIKRIEVQLKHLLENELDLVGTQMLPIDRSGRVIGAQSRLPLSHELIEKIANFSSPLTHIWICKKEIYDKLGGYRKVPYAEDFDFLLRAIDSGFKCGNTSVALTKIRHRHGNTSDIASLSQRKGYFYALELHKQRKAQNYDSYNDVDAAKLIKHNKLVNYFHSLSTKCLHKAFQSNNKLEMFFYTLLSAVMSFYNAHYIYQRIKVKMLLSNQ
ncbi:glycosyltransferase family 2 protein [Escherichia coli]|jgi:glycosyltransferase involved in cell wall biosynthesis|uniref:WbdN n=10 Tax=Enterobacteriaceae TaxID=543 RepID=A0A377B8R1_ECOLX|nr:MULTISPECIES: glycosyltransferase family 2 protein [Enterobacteriaceae]EFN8711959.1 glycosyltransferase family 2 protein [Escherichia coli O130]EKH5369612.1 glycosyltransferase family 2 protein [Escherichia coli O33]ELB9666831.1 glycosyltransferase family 2 protein [Escherichia coli O26]EAB0915127.1 glycosyltransferase family 2 protein [Escherichia coli]EEQ7661382.1 glycosyltransferase family 2 protein [Escherichia coli]